MIFQTSMIMFHIILQGCIIHLSFQVHPFPQKKHPKNSIWGTPISLLKASHQAGLNPSWAKVCCMDILMEGGLELKLYVYTQSSLVSSKCEITNYW